MAISGPAPTKMEGFTTAGNCFYDAFEPGQTRVKPGGIRHARHVNLSAARDTESALEMYFSGAYGEKTRRGVFTWSLLETLRQNGTNLTYAELLHRVELMVRTRVDNQIPVLGKTLPGDDGLLFFRNQLRPKKPETFYAAFDERTENWTLNAGALNGIPDPATGIQACVRLDNRMIRITHVLPGQATLDATAFTDADKNLKTLAVTLDGAWLRHIVVGWSGLNDAQQQAIRNAFEHNPPTYARLDPDNETPQYLIKTVPAPHSNFAPCFILTRPGSNVPLFMRTPQAHQFVTDLAQVCRYEHVLQLQNPASAIPPDAVTVFVSTLEGVYYDAESFKTISKNDEAFHPVANQSASLAPYPAVVRVQGKIVQGRRTHPALKIRITANPGSKYWVGALYCDEKMGISSAFLPVTKIGFGENTDYLDADFMQGTYRALPLNIDPAWLTLGVSEIQDYLVVFVSTQKFNLSQYEQAGIVLDTTRSIGFSNNKAFYKEDWRTIKIPIHVCLPMESQVLAAGRELTFNGFTLGVPNDITGSCTPVTRARMREVPPGQDWYKVLPPDTLWDGVEGSTEVFTRGVCNLPGTHVCMLEMQADYLHIGADNAFTVYPNDAPDAAEAIVPFGYDTISNNWKPMGYTLESGSILLTDLPGYTPHCFTAPLANGENQSIKVFFQKVVWDGTVAEQDGLHVRRVAFPVLNNTPQQ
jgi:hypothetical protein